METTKWQKERLENEKNLFKRRQGAEEAATKNHLEKEQSYK